MNLPTVPLKTDTLQIAGETVTFRSLSRAEALRLTEFGEGHEGEAEDFMLAQSLGITAEEAHAWRDATDVVTSQPLIEAIAKLSGLSADPKA